LHLPDFILTEIHRAAVLPKPSSEGAQAVKSSAKPRS
jgi:hypothetical protein